jgi:hypothetical protein
MSKGRVFHKIAVVMKKGDPVTVEQFHTVFKDTKVEPVLYRLSTYIWNIKKNGGVIKAIKNGRKVIGYQLLNGTEFDSNGRWVGIVPHKEVA